MAAVISIYPYDPGTDAKRRRNVHGVKSYYFWPSHNEEQFDHEKDVGLSIPDGRRPLELPPKTLSALYFLIQLFVRYCLSCLKRVAVTVKIYPISNDNKRHGEKRLDKLIDHDDHGREDLEKLADRKDDGELSAVVAPSNLIDLKVDQSGMREQAHDFGGYLEKFDFSKTPCGSTTFSTSIFEVKNDGLHNLIKDIRLEIRKHQSNLGDAFGPTRGSIVACCDLVWSVPSKFRSYWTETYVENEIRSLMDWNNQQIYDLLFSNTFGLRRASRGGTTQKIGATDSRTDTFVGVYRHFYPELMDMANRQAAQDHESIWKFDPKSSNIRMNWPIIGDFSATTVVALNLIILKF